MRSMILSASVSVLSIVLAGLSLGWAFAVVMR